MQTVAFPKSYCLLKSVYRLVQIFTGNIMLEEEVWPFCILPCILALQSVQGRVWAGSLSVRCQMFVLFPPRKEKLSSSLGCSRYQHLSSTWLNRVRPLPSCVTLAHVIFAAAPIIRWGVSLRHSLNTNQEVYSAFCTFINSMEGFHLGARGCCLGGLVCVLSLT